MRRNQVTAADWPDTAGSGVAIMLGRCVPFALTDPPAAIRHSPERTEISITGDFSKDPVAVEPVFAEFELRPRTRNHRIAESPVLAVRSAGIAK